MCTISKTLSVCIISKNEEKNIARCINSVKNIADEIILVDTGSTDNTVEIAKSLGAIVVTHIWNNDFSAARNKSIENATKDWILFLDCDEILPEAEGLKLKEFINEDNKYEAYYMRLINFISDTRISDAIVLRAFKNKEQYRFSGKMHEQIVKSIQLASGIDSVRETPVEIYHYGYDPNLSDTSVKSKRNLEILLSYDEKDKDGYYYYVLGNEYARIDNYNEALKHYYSSLNMTNAKMYRYIYYPYLVANIVKTLFVQKRFNEALKQIKDTEDTLPAYKDLYFLECLCNMEMCNLTNANEALEKFINCPVGNYEYPSSNYENFHDISKLHIDLTNGLIPHEKNMLTVWINMNTWDDHIVDCIKSINEIAYEVLVITSNPSELKLDVIRQYGGKVLILSKDNANKSFQMSMKQSRGKYILVLNPNEICSYRSQIQITNLLSNNDMGEGFGLRIVNQSTSEYDLRLSLYKTNKKISSIEEYEKYLRSKDLLIDDIEIYIHSKALVKEEN